MHGLYRSCVKKRFGHCPNLHSSNSKSFLISGMEQFLFANNLYGPFCRLFPTPFVAHVLGTVCFHTVFIPGALVVLDFHEN